MNYLQILGIGTLLLMLNSCSDSKQKSNSAKRPAPIVDIQVAEFKDFQNSIETHGTVLANEMVDLYSEAQGRIVYLHMPDGAFVTEGTVLAKINSTDLHAQLQQYKAQYQLAQKNRERLQALLAIHGVNQAEYDAAEQQVLQVEAQIKVIEAQIEKTIVKAPFSGTLGLRLVSQGAFVNSQTKLGSLHQTDKVKIDFMIPETYIQAVSVGKKILVQTSQNQKFYATIAAVEPHVNTATRNVKVRALLEKSQLQPGSHVKILLTQTTQSILVPTNAIIPDAFTNQVVLVKQGKAKFTVVETGERAADYIAITRGIEAGDTIVVAGVLFVRPNEQVQVRKK